MSSEQSYAKQMSEVKPESPIGVCSMSWGGGFECAIEIASDIAAQADADLAALRAEIERLRADDKAVATVITAQTQQIAALREQLEAKDARIAELEAVAGNPPRTADAQPAYHGMKVWRRCGLDGAIIGETLTLRCDPDGGTTPEEVYSTREAALAAAEAKP